MDILDTILFLQEQLNAKTGNGELLAHVNIEVDPYKSLEKSVPFVLVEPDDSDLESATQGHVVKNEHKIIIYCIVNAHNVEYLKYKRAAIDLAKNVITATTQIQDYRFLFEFKKKEYSEITIGSLKCSGVILRLTAETN